MPRVTPARVMLLLSVLAMFIPGYTGLTQPWTLEWKVKFMKSIVKVLGAGLGGSKAMLVYSALSMYIPGFFEPGGNPIPKQDRYAQPSTPSEGVCPENHTLLYSARSSRYVMPKNYPLVQYYSWKFTQGVCPANHTFWYNQTLRIEEDTGSEWYLPRAFYDPMLPYSVFAAVAMVLVPPMHRKYVMHRKIRTFPLPVGVRPQGFMPTLGGVNVMSTATLHSAASVQYNYTSRVWSIHLTFESGSGATPYVPFLLDQRSPTGPSLNFFSEVAPWCGVTRGYCCYGDFLNSTVYFNDALYSALSGIGDCEGHVGEWAAALVGSSLSSYGGIRPSSHIAFDFQTGVLHIPHEEAQRYGREYLDENNKYVIDLRFAAVFQGGGGEGLLNLAWVPYQAVLLRDIDDLYQRSYQDVRECVDLQQPKPEHSFWLARYRSPDSGERVCEWFCDVGYYSYPLHALEMERKEGYGSVPGAVCAVPPPDGIAVGYSLWLLMNTTELSLELGQAVVPQNLTMDSAPSVPRWLDSLAANLSAGLAREAAGIAGRAVGVRAVAELRDTKYAREWRVYMQTLRSLYERKFPGTAIDGLQTVFLRDGRSEPYAFPDWLQGMGVFDQESTVDVGVYPVARRSGRVSISVGGGSAIPRRQLSAPPPINALALEVVVYLDSQGLTLGDVVNSIFQSGVAMVNSTEVRGLWGMDIYVREMTVRVEPVKGKFRGGFVVVILLAGAAIFLLCLLLCRPPLPSSYERLRASSKQVERHKHVGELDNLHRFESEAIVTTLNEIAEGGMQPRTRILGADDCHTLVRSTLTLSGADGCGRVLGSAMMKLPVGVPGRDDFASSGAMLSRLLAPGSSLFGEHEEVRSAMQRHLRGVSEGEEIQKTEGREEPVPHNLMGALIFAEVARAGDRFGPWEVQSKIGPCLVCARSMVRGNGSHELEWAAQARACRAVSGLMERVGLDIVRHCITARRGAETYTLDSVLLPVGPSSNDALCCTVVKMAGGEVPAGWSTHVHTAELNQIDTRKGSNRYDLVCAQAANLLRHAKQVSAKHLENQVLREVLRMRPEPLSDEARRLTGKHNGAYLKSEVHLQQLNDELRREMTAAEVGEAEAWVGLAMSRRRPYIRCVQGSMAKNYDPSGLEVSTVGAELNMKFSFSAPCVTEAFQGRSIAVELGNRWRPRVFLGRDGRGYELQRLLRVSEAKEPGDHRVEVPQGTVLPGRPEQRRRVVMGGDEEGLVGPQRSDGGAEVADDTAAVAIVLEALDEALGQRVDGPHHLGRSHSRWGLDGLQHVVDGEEPFLLVAALDEDLLRPAGDRHDDVHLRAGGRDADAVVPQHAAGEEVAGRGAHRRAVGVGRLGWVNEVVVHFLGKGSYPSPLVLCPVFWGGRKKSSSRRIAGRTSGATPRVWTRVVMTEDEILEHVEQAMDSEMQDVEVKAKKSSKGRAKKSESKGVTKRAATAKPSKPRRPFSRLTDEVLQQRQDALQERLNVSKAQITIMSSKWQKYEDERKHRVEDKQEDSE
ncbi:hypothetical protein GUITHDRAFT_145991 [Guillardia theta CCMP2712]|uniref:Uncharacterized protein n=2 Tax=Guillardia theta (strain CCMP2712) TaxID=905079 RepID=L1IK46_GUITC|nr:hypothetical protein GUITHDRAFT_145991 [Guillardia theta CCMP2712]EKX36180.1 hypothetical protein GUITHDRAFT_145991 [Guillardia theta CCMP2712]|eukprot:XP_005823160.1 hypothetical protein GUITHDRAFT_145991 [Guillardia theta CCMP2712]